jgi:hypothetical protein
VCDERNVGSYLQPRSWTITFNKKSPKGHKKESKDFVPLSYVKCLKQRPPKPQEENWKLLNFKRTKLKTPNVPKIKPKDPPNFTKKKKSPNCPKLIKTWKEQNWRLQKMIRTKLKNPKFTKTKVKALSSQNKIIKIQWNEV